MCDEPRRAFPDLGQGWRRPPAQRSCALEDHSDVVSLTKQQKPPSLWRNPVPRLLLLLYYHYGSSLLFTITPLASSSSLRRHDNGLLRRDFLFISEGDP